MSGAGWAPAGRSQSWAQHRGRLPAPLKDSNALLRHLDFTLETVGNPGLVQAGERDEGLPPRLADACRATSWCWGEGPLVLPCDPEPLFSPRTPSACRRLSSSLPPCVP